MSLSRPICVFALSTLLTAATPGTSRGEDWPQLRGPNRVGVSSAVDVFPAEGFHLEVAWRQPIGSGYSDVSVVGDRAITFFTSGEEDVIAAFDVGSGKELWRHVIAEAYKGHSGSDDGPLSTPVIVDGSVYGLGPRGDLFALDLATGAPRWQRRLSEDEAVAPYYGFTTSPLVIGDRLILATGGGDGRAITAVDRATGGTLWHQGDGGIDYQSPLRLTVAGRDHVLVSTDDALLGLDPKTGQALWWHAHGMEGSVGTPLPVDGNGVMVRAMDEVAVFDIDPSGDTGFRVNERWRSNVFQQSYAAPVFDRGYAYGMSRTFLTGVDVRDGSRVWRSRPPGGNGLALVDGHIAIVGSGGELVIVKATPEGYEESARLDVFEHAPHSAPSFAAGQFFVRDLTSLVAVRIRPGAKVGAEAETAEPIAYLGALGASFETIATLPEVQRQARVDALFEGKPVAPITELSEGAAFAHILYRGDVQDVAVGGNIPGARPEVPLHRLPGTDLYFRSFELGPAGIWQYQMTIDLGDPDVDPGNPRTMTVRDTRWSILSMPDARPTPHLDPLPAGTARGRLETFTLASTHGVAEREVTVYLPAGYDHAATPLPLLVYTMGHVRAALGFETVLDASIATEAIEPVVVAFLARASGDDHDAQADDYVSMLTDDLLPALASRYRLTRDPEQRAIAGLVSGAGVAIHAGRAAGRHFGKVGSQSLLVNGLEGIFETRDVEGLDVYLELRPGDGGIGDGTASGAEVTRRLAEALLAGGARVELVELDHGVGLMGWRTSLDQMLVALFGPDAKE